MCATPFKQPTHFSIVDDFPTRPDDIPDPSLPLVRWIRIGDRIFGVTPDTCYSHLLDDGTDYYPYYDNDLADATPHDLTTYPISYFLRVYGVDESGSL